MEIISVVPRGYCQGVVRAIKIAQDTIQKYPDRRVTMLGMIVHNAFVVEECRKLGITFVEDPKKTRLELLDDIEDGVVIFTAHGVDETVRQKAEDKGLIVVDATCPDVVKTHDLVKEHSRHGDVLYIGKKNHPESEGTVGLSDRVHLITSAEDIDSFTDLKDVLITNQTTLSVLDTSEIIEKCLEKYPDAKVVSEICNATRLRQEAVMKLENTDLLIVVGDPRSNNSNQLKQIALRSGIPEALLIGSVQELKPQDVQNKNHIAVTSGSSTPNSLTAQVIDFLKDYAESGEWNMPETISCRLL